MGKDILDVERISFYSVCVYDQLWCAKFCVILANSLVRLSVIAMCEYVSECLNHHKRN